jgi:hypothetical protein
MPSGTEVLEFLFFEKKLLKFVNTQRRILAITRHCAFAATPTAVGSNVTKERFFRITV